MKTFLKTVAALATLVLYCSISFAQLTGTLTVPSTTYPDLATAITALNTQGVGVGGVTLNITAGNNQSAPAGGYQLGSTLLNASTSAVNPIIINGNSNTITAQPGVSTTVDGIFFLKGIDYVTINALNIAENPTDTNATLAMEYGYALVQLNATAPFDGCQNNIIKNCTITLNRVIATPSAGIFSGHTTATSNAALTITTVGDTHRNNKFYSNTIRNVTTAIQLNGFNAVSPYTLYDKYNDIGGSSAATGNNITNFGGANYTGIGGITAIYQDSLNTSYNTLNDTANGGVAAIGGIWGIYPYGTNSTLTANNNNITLVTAFINTGYFGYGIYSNALGTNLTASNNNIVISQPTGSAAIDYGMFTVNGNNLTVTSDTVKVLTGVSSATVNIYSTYIGTVNINNNVIRTGNTAAVSATWYGIYNSVLTTNQPLVSNVGGNIYDNITTNNSGTHYLMYPYNYSANQNITNNRIAGGFTRQSSGTTYCVYDFGSPSSGTSTISGNNFSNITVLGTGSTYGLYYFTTTTHNHIVFNDTFSNWTNPGAGLMYGMYLPSGNVNTVYNNLVTNLSTTYTSTMYGMYISPGTTTGTGQSIYNNTVSNLTTSGTPYMLYVPAGGTANVYGNTLTGLVQNSTSALSYGLYSTGGTNTSFYNNKIYNLQSAQTSGAAIYGMYFTTSTNTSIYNNIISDIRSTAANSVCPVYGMYFSGGTLFKVYYNTIFLNPISSGANFGAAGIFYAAAIGSFDLRNNIVNVNAAPAGSGFTAAVRRDGGTSGVAPANLATTSNSNIYYAPNVSNSYLYAEGTSLPLLNAYNLTNDVSFNTPCGLYKAFMSPRESSTFTENNLTQIGTTATYAPTGVSFAKSNAVATTSPAVTVDFNNVARPATPDIGALQFTGTGSDAAGPAISYTALPVTTY